MRPTPPPLDFRAAYQKLHNAPTTDAFSAYAFDAWLVLADAAARVGAKTEPGSPQYRAALRDAIVSTKELVGTHGVYNFKPDGYYGVDERARVMIMVKDGAFRLAK